MASERDYINAEPGPGVTGFDECLVSLNSLSDAGFEEWVFYPGMLFNAATKWWGDKGNRNRPHEGLDLCLFRTGDGEIRHLSKEVIIPLILDGEVAKTSSDFLGESVFVYHNIYNKLRGQLLTAYGHLKLDERVCSGKVFQEGEPLGSISDTGDRKGGILPHLHISVAWISKSLRYEDLNWECISDPSVAVLLDPLEVLDFRYSMLT